MPGEKQNSGILRSHLFLELKSFTLEVVDKLGKDNIPRLASSFSFYAILSIAPFLVFAVSIAGYLASRGQATHRLEREAMDWGGPQMRDYVTAVIESTKSTGTGVLWTILSLAVTFFSASNLFMQLQDAIGTIWGVVADGSFVRRLISARIVAFLSVLVYGSMLIALLTLDSVLSWIARHGGGFTQWPGYSFLITFVLLTVGFIASMRAFPRGHLKIWDTVPGALFCAIVLGIGKYGLSAYFSRTTSVYPAAGGVVILLLFLYYSSMLYLVGVEITYVFSHRYGSLKGLKRS